MKHISWVLALPVALLCFAHADSIPTLNVSHVNYTFFANEGSDNAEYHLVGAGINLSGGGSVGCSQEFCVEGVPFTPGTLLVPSLFVDFESSSGSVMIGGHTYHGPDEVGLFVSSINAAGFRFPAGRRPTISVTVPASFATVHGEVADGTIFAVNIPSGKLVLTFKYVPAINSYYFLDGAYTTAPEPTTVLLMLTGFGGIMGLRRKRHR